MRNVNLIEALDGYRRLIIDYPMFYLVLLSFIIFSLILYLNRKRKISKILIMITIISIIISSFYMRGLSIITEIPSIFSIHILNNIYFYYWNMFIFGFIFLYRYSKAKRQILDLTFFTLLLTNYYFLVIITNVVKNIYLLVIGNVYPMVMIGNIIMIIYYVITIITIVLKNKAILTKKH